MPPLILAKESKNFCGATANSAVFHFWEVVGLSPHLREAKPLV